MQLFRYIILIGISCASLASAAATCTLKTETDPTRCGVRATLLPDAQSLYAPFSISKLASKEECADLCARRINPVQTGYIDMHEPPYRPQYLCNAFFFDAKAGVCQLLDQNLAKAQLDKNNTHSPEVFYQADCFNCGITCDQPNYSQLLDNGDFEDPAFGPWTLDYSRRAPGRNSSTAYQCVGDYSYYSCILGQQFNFCEGSLYMVRFDYLATGPYSLNGLTAQSLFIANFSSVDYGKWRTGWLFQKKLGPYTYIYDVGQVQFLFGNPQNNTDERGLKIDNVYASRIPNPPPLVKGTTNLVKNPGFETGKLEPWAKVSGTANLTMPGLSGSKYALQCKCTISQTISTVAGKAYLFQFAYNNPKKKDYTELAYTISTNYDRYEYSLRSPNGFNTTSIPFVAHGPQTTIEISASPSRGGIVSLDNFSVKEADINLS